MCVEDSSTVYAKQKGAVMITVLVRTQRPPLAAPQEAKAAARKGPRGCLGWGDFALHVFFILFDFGMCIIYIF